jgi:hypothetical protein
MRDGDEMPGPKRRIPPLSVAGHARCPTVTSMSSLGNSCTLNTRATSMLGGRYIDVSTAFFGAVVWAAWPTAATFATALSMAS